jgi:hypothetical protein
MSAVGVALVLHPANEWQRIAGSIMWLTGSIGLIATGVATCVGALWLQSVALLKPLPFVVVGLAILGIL